MQDTLNDKQRFYLKLTVLLLVLAYIVLRSFVAGDFKIYLGASKLLLEGKNCYNVWIPTHGNEACGYSYSPFFALLLAPLAYLPFQLAQGIWLSLNIYFLYRIYLVLTFYLELKERNREHYLITFLSLLACLRFILHNFEMVQVTIFMVYICLESMYYVSNDKDMKAGFILSLGIIIKILPIVLLPYWIYRNNIKAASFSIILVIFYLFFPAFIYGWSFNQKLLTDWWNIINPNNPEFILLQNSTGEGVHGLSAWVARYFGENSVSKQMENIKFMELGKEPLNLLLNTLRLAFIGFVLYFLRSKPFHSYKSNTHTLWELSYILAITPLIFPNQQRYAFFFLMPASTYLVWFLVKAKTSDSFNPLKRNLLLASFLIYFTQVSIPPIFTGNQNDYYKVITWGTFLLLLLLAFSSPDQLRLDKRYEYKNSE